MKETKIAMLRFLVGQNLREANFAFDTNNYDGYTFATALAAKLIAAVDGFVVKPDLFVRTATRKTK